MKANSCDISHISHVCHIKQPFISHIGCMKNIDIVSVGLVIMDLTVVFTLKAKKEAHV